MKVKVVEVTKQEYQRQLYDSYKTVTEIGRMIKSGLSDTVFVDAATLAEYHLARHHCFVSIDALPECSGREREEILRIHGDLVATMELPKGVRVADNKSLAALELTCVKKYEKMIREEALQSSQSSTVIK